MREKKQRVKSNPANKKIFFLLTLQSGIVVVAALGSLFFVELLIRHFNADYADLTFLAIVIPMAVVIGVINYFITKIVYRYVSFLAEGIGKVAEGDFTVRLDDKKGGPLAEVYGDFNKMCAELSNVELLKNEFLNDYAHELRTPITSINGFAKLLLENDVTEEERRAYLQLIADESKRLAELSNSTMVMARLDSQTIVADREEYNLGEQLRQCVILLSMDWGKKNLNLDGTEIKDVLYKGNKTLMQEVWCNLLSNAVKYTPKGGEIRIRVDEDEKNVFVSVADTGEGINENALKHIFEKYYQSDKSHAAKGLGLGLAIVDRIVKLCNGKIEVESALNEGSTFTVTLPK
ncbi:MAG: sensor histidine kinase [Bacillota bacterium]|nr:MAG: sensor histidine kinase [Bacillota bacterium]